LFKCTFITQATGGITCERDKLLRKPTNYIIIEEKYESSNTGARNMNKLERREGVGGLLS
jgi:hypothetical protein